MRADLKSLIIVVPLLAGCVSVAPSVNEKDVIAAMQADDPLAQADRVKGLAITGEVFDKERVKVAEITVSNNVTEGELHLAPGTYSLLVKAKCQPEARAEFELTWSDVMDHVVVANQMKKVPMVPGKGASEQRYLQGDYRLGTFPDALGKTYVDALAAKQTSAKPFSANAEVEVLRYWPVVKDLSACNQAIARVAGTEGYQVVWKNQIGKRKVKLEKAFVPIDAAKAKEVFSRLEEEVKWYKVRRLLDEDAPSNEVSLAKLLKQKGLADTVRMRLTGLADLGQVGAERDLVTLVEPRDHTIYFVRPGDEPLDQRLVTTVIEDPWVVAVPTVILPELEGKALSNIEALVEIHDDAGGLYARVLGMHVDFYRHPSLYYVLDDYLIAPEPEPEEEGPDVKKIPLTADQWAGSAPASSGSASSGSASSGSASAPATSPAASAPGGESGAQSQP